MFPVLLTLGGWRVPAYGTGLALAFVAGWAITLGLGRRDRLPVGPLGTAYVLSAMAGLVVARVAWVLQHPDAYAGPASLLALRAGELAPFAGVVAALLVSAMYLAAKRIPPTVAWDVAAPGFAAGSILERAGALLAGTGAGKYAPNLEFAIRFPPGSPVFEAHRDGLAGLLPPGATESLPVHPTQVYGMLLGALGLWLCLRWRARRRFSGQVALSFGIYVLIARAFVEEWFRADASQAVFGPLSGGQVAAAVLIVAIAVVLRARGLRAAGRDDGLRLWEGGRWSPGGPPRRAKARPVVVATSSDAAASRSGSGQPKSKPKPKAGKAKGGHKGKRRRGRKR